MTAIAEQGVARRSMPLTRAGFRRWLSKPDHDVVAVRKRRRSQDRYSREYKIYVHGKKAGTVDAPSGSTALAIGNYWFNPPHTPEN